MAVKKISEAKVNLSPKDDGTIRQVLEYIDDTIENLRWIDTFVLGNGSAFKVNDEEIQSKMTDAFLKHGIFVYDTRCNDIFYDCITHLNSIRSAITDVSGIYNSYSK